MDDVVPVVKDDEQRAVPTAWRPRFEAIVRSFVSGDFSASGIDGVRPVPTELAEYIRDNVEGYGNVTLAELEDDTWRTSVVMWERRTRWGVLVDLRTAEEGRSDLVLHAYVHETEASEYEIEIFSVYVP